MNCGVALVGLGIAELLILAVLGSGLIVAAIVLIFFLGRKK